MRSCTPGSSRIGARPALMLSTVRGLMSQPTTTCPFETYWAARAVPILPSPTTAILMICTSLLVPAAPPQAEVKDNSFLAGPTQCTAAVRVGSRPSAPIRAHAVRDTRDLIAAELGVHRQGEDLAHEALRVRQGAGRCAVARAGELQVHGYRVVHRRADARAVQIVAQAVTVGRADDIDVVDVLAVAALDGCLYPCPSQGLTVEAGVAAARLLPRVAMAQLHPPHRGPEVIPARVTGPQPEGVI